jgi:WD40 repeat protein
MKTATYQLGGSLPSDAPSYVTRPTDRELYELLHAGEFCHVLNSRQMGKSSLRVRLMQRLQAEGICCADIDITLIGTQQVSPQQWYGSLIRNLVSQFDLRDKFDQRRWWGDRQELSPVQCFGEFIEEVLLKEIAQPLVIFIDEIDSILQLEFKDDFFALIRACYNKRADHIDFKRLTFVLLGVATPADLIGNSNNPLSSQRTPFNIGRPVELHGFQLAEVQPLINGLLEKASNPKAVLQAILFWTGGQPFLTQKLCQLVRDVEPFIPEGLEAQRVEILVRSRVIESWESQDDPEHLKTIRNRLIAREQLTLATLSLYQQILKGKEVLTDHSTEQTHLLLSGIVVKQDNKLTIYNKIYELIFNIKWIKGILADQRPYAQEFADWIASHYDKSFLLQGQVLRETMMWAESKILSSQDFHYLQASQKLEIQKFEQAFIDAKQQFDETQKKTKRQLYWGIASLSVSLLGAFTVIALAINFSIISQKSNLNDLKSSAQTLLSSNLLPEALLASLKAGRLLETSIISVPSKLESDTVRTLQQIVDIIQYPVLEGHKGDIYSVVFSPDNQTIATASEDKTAKLWSLNGKEIQTLKGHLDHVWTVRFSPDSRKIATASWDGTVKIWSWNGKYSHLIKTFEGHENHVFSISFSPDGERLVSVGEDKIVRLWNLTSYALINSWDSEHTKNVVCVSFSPDGKTIATASDDHTARLWRQDGILLKVFKGHTNEVNGISFSPNGKTIATASDDHTAKLWSLQGKTLQTLRGHSEQLISANFSPDGKIIATSSFDQTVKLWGLDGKIKQTLLPKHKAWVWDASFNFNGQWLASASRDRTVRLWPMNSGKRSTLSLKNSLKTGCSYLNNYLKAHPSYSFAQDNEMKEYCRNRRMH